MSLTTHQSNVLQEGLEILRRGDHLLIKGSAGVGKTYMVNELIKTFRLPPNKEIYCSAPTNKAVQVLREKVSEMAGLSFLTTHSAMKMKKQINFRTGEISFKPQFSPKYPPLTGVGLFIIDEASMLNSELLSFVETYAAMFRVKLVFIGDDKQLNPVKEEVSPIFTRNYPTVELIEIVRQAKDNPIINLSRNLENIPSKISNFSEDMEGNKKGYLYSNDKMRVVETLAKVNGSDQLKYLAFTNRDVDEMNLLVRNRIYGNPAKIEIGETMIFNSPYDKSFYTNQELKITDVDVKTQDFRYMNDMYGSATNEPGEAPMYQYKTLKFYSINSIKTEDGDTCNILVIHEDSEKDFEAVKSLLRSKVKLNMAEWVHYYEFIETFADLKYNHAITVHKSQGSTFKQAIVNVNNININRNTAERLRLLYTAITRASDLLILYNIK